MLRKLSLEPMDSTEEQLSMLEDRGLIERIRHPDEKLRAHLTQDFFKGAGFKAEIHDFHSVTITYTDIFLASHPPGQSEIVMMWDPFPSHKPLYFVFALHNRTAYLDLLRGDKITEKDYLVMRMRYNDPSVSAFIVFPGTVHCELTDADGKGLANPSFFVLEPAELTVMRTEEEQFGIQLALRH